MNSKQFRLVLLGIFGLTLIAFIAIWTLGLSALKKQSNKMVELKVANQTADAQLANLESSKKEVQKYSYFKSIASSVIPNDKDQAQAVLEIYEIANASGISIQSITFPTSDLGSKVTSSATAASSKAALTSQAKPVAGIKDLYSVELTITPVTGSDVPADKQVTFPKLLNFLKKVENNRRTAQITQVNIQPIEGSNQINFTLIINIFIKP